MKMSERKLTDLEEYITFLHKSVNKDDLPEWDKVRFTIQVSKSDALKLEELGKILRMKRATLASEIVSVSLSDIARILGVEGTKEYVCKTEFMPLSHKLVTEEFFDTSYVGREIELDEDKKVIHDGENVKISIEKE